MIYGVKDSRKQPVAQIKVKFHIHIDNRRFPDNAFGNSQSFADIICSADFWKTAFPWFQTVKNRIFKTGYGFSLLKLKFDNIQIPSANSRVSQRKFAFWIKIVKKFFLWACQGIERALRRQPAAFQCIDRAAEFRRFKVFDIKIAVNFGNAVAV